MFQKLLKPTIFVLGICLIAFGAVVVKKVSLIDQKKCVKCGTCFKVCPVKAVTKTEKDGKIISCVIDPAKCIGCGTCVKNCPVKAIALVTPADKPAVVDKNVSEAKSDSVSVPKKNNPVKK